jgi:hypothetical protein
MNRFVVVALLLSTVVFAALDVPGSVHAQARAGQSKITWAIQQGISRPARELRSKPRPASAPRTIPFHRLPVVPGSAENPPERVTQAPALRPLVAATSSLNIAGMGAGDYGFTDQWTPPDTNGAAGATQYVQGVNTSFAVFAKSNGALIMSPLDFNQLWPYSTTDPCYAHAIGDQLVRYDNLADRWVFAFLAGTSADFQECVAVSTTADATGAYNRYAFDFGTELPDYAKLGVWPTAYFVSYDIFSGNSFLGARVCAWNRAAMLSGAAVSQQCFQLSSSYAHLLPSDLDGTIAPPSGEPGFFLNLGANAQSLNLWKFSPNFRFPRYGVLVGPTAIAVTPFSTACQYSNETACIPQAGTGQALSSMGDRVMYRLAYRHFVDGHEALVVNHAVGVGFYISNPPPYPPTKINSVGIRWYEIRDPNGTPTLYQQGTFAPDPTYRWMGSIAMDRVGDIALGYSASSGTLYPGMRYTGRVPSDALGTMEAEATVQKGGNFQADYHWGDYSGMSVDPVDDCTFWYTTEYLKSGYSSWSTRIASFRFPGC